MNIYSIYYRYVKSTPLFIVQLKTVTPDHSSISNIFLQKSCPFNFVQIFGPSAIMINDNVNYVTDWFFSKLFKH